MQLKCNRYRHGVHAAVQKARDPSSLVGARALGLDAALAAPRTLRRVCCNHRTKQHISSRSMRSTGQPVLPAVFGQQALPASQGRSTTDAPCQRARALGNAAHKIRSHVLACLNTSQAGGTGQQADEATATKMRHTDARPS